MPRRRQFGSVRKLPSGKWQARYESPGGSSVAAPHTFATKADAALWLASVELDQARGRWIDPRASDISLAANAENWLHGHVRIAPRTREIYELQLRVHILPKITADVPALGGLSLGDISPEIVRRWYGALTRERGRSVAAKAYTRLRQILTVAVNDDRI